jgi:hypothetical protein
MIVVRNTFIAKPGQAGKLAAHLKEIATAGNLRNARVLTDLTGDFNHVVMEHEVESASEFEELLKRYASDPKVQSAARPFERAAGRNDQPDIAFFAEQRLEFSELPDG